MKRERTHCSSGFQRYSPIADRARLGVSAIVCGFIPLGCGRIGGDTMSVTSGVVSRIEVTSYVHGSSELLGVQIDAAINAGNSGADPRTVDTVVLVERATSPAVSAAAHTCMAVAPLHICHSVRQCCCAATASLCACRRPSLHKPRRVLRHRVPEPAGARSHMPHLCSCPKRCPRGRGAVCS